MTWTIVSAVVLTSAWLAESVQTAHEEQGDVRLRVAQQDARRGGAAHHAGTPVVQAKDSQFKAVVAKR